MNLKSLIILISFYNINSSQSLPKRRQFHSSIRITGLACSGIISENKRAATPGCHDISRKFLEIRETKSISADDLKKFRKPSSRTS